jgi:hypothetical protein
MTTVDGTLFNITDEFERKPDYLRSFKKRTSAHWHFEFLWVCFGENAGIMRVKRVKGLRSHNAHDFVQAESRLLPMAEALPYGQGLIEI